MRLYSYSGASKTSLKRGVLVKIIEIIRYEVFNRRYVQRLEKSRQLH